MRELFFQCAAWGRQTSATAGTIFQDARTPLAIWFRAIRFVASQTTPTSARTLQRVLGLGSHQTAWTWLNELRRAMVRPGRVRPTGRVEVDETHIGALEQGRARPRRAQESLDFFAAEQDGAGIGRVRLRRIRDASADTLRPFIDEVIEPGSIVHTDAWLGYVRLKAHACRHRITFLSDVHVPI